jgi:TM2 domain-containing membrane protein YozV
MSLEMKAAPIIAAPPQSEVRHIRAQKIVGLTLMMVAVAPAVYMVDQVEQKAWLHTGTVELVHFALFNLAVGNFFSLGLVTLLAGLADHDLLKSRQARSGALARLSGANLLMVIFAFTSLYEEGVLDPYIESWLFVPMLIAFIAIGRAGVLCFRRGWRFEAVGAEGLVAQDARTPIVYIRSFKNDERIASRFLWTAAFSVEQELATVMNRVGPMIAIGKPGEALPQLGAARLYVDDDHWRSTITDLMKRARLVVVLAGGTANLQWEIDQAAALVSRQRLIFIVPPSVEASPFERAIEQRFGKPQVLRSEPQEMLLTWLARLLNRSPQGKILYFGADSKPYAECMQYALSWEGLVLSPYRPYRDTLNASCRRVFKELDLPWAERKSRTVAVLLAFFGGAFGLHHFYIGNRRRGMCYLGFCWTLVPLFLAWIDAFKLAMTDEEAFDRLSPDIAIDG